MKAKAKKTTKMTASQKALLTLVASQVKGKSLFPERVKAAKELLQNLQDSGS